MTENITDKNTSKKKKLILTGTIVVVLACIAGYSVKKAQNATAEDEEPSIQAPQEIVNLSIELQEGIAINMVKIEAAGVSITMGTGEKQETATIPQDYYIGKYEVTQEQWKAVMGNNPSLFKGEKNPVERVSRGDVLEFCEHLNATGKAPDGWEFTLPTEAQWEYAASGGQYSRGYRYSGSNTLKKVAWYADNSHKQTHPAGEKKANELGIYDMSGNVWEWCLDKFQPENNNKTDGEKAASNDGCSIRGGCWDNSGNDNPARDCPINGRYYVSAESRSNSLGFRITLVPKQ